MAVRDEAREMWPDARPQARENRRGSRWNTLRMFSSQERRRRLLIVRRCEKVNVGQAISRSGLTNDEPLTRVSPCPQIARHGIPRGRFAAP